MQPQVDVIMNHILHTDCHRTKAEMRSWLKTSMEEHHHHHTTLGTTAHMSEHMAELQYQRKALARRTKIDTKSQSPLKKLDDSTLSMEDILIEVGRRSGLSLESWQS